MNNNRDSVRPGAEPGGQGLSPSFATGPWHVCAFLDEHDDEYQVLGRFYREALRPGSRTLHIVAGTELAGHRACLESLGANTADCEACGRLALMPAERAGLDAAGRFDRHRLLRALGEGGEVDASRDDDLHVVVRMAALLGREGGGDRSLDEVLTYEAQLNQRLSGRRKSVLCLYEVASLNGATMMDLLRTHPMTLIGGVLRENPFYSPPAEILPELAARAGGGLDPRQRVLR